MFKRIPKMATAIPGPRLGDLTAGISVALIAIPQSLAYAELAGMPAYRGLYAVALPTFLAAFLSRYPTSKPVLWLRPCCLRLLF